MNRITVKLGKIPIEINSKSGFMENFCRLYLTDESAVFSVKASEETVKSEMASSDLPIDYEYAEALCIYREIAERLPFYDSVVFHGAAIEHGGKAYIFTAPSGTGKTTHISLWRKYLGDKVDIVNGDKPILRRENDGFTVYGTPYAGKEGWQRNVSAPLAGICILSQGKDNKIEKADAGLFARLFQQTYRPKSKEAMEKTVPIVKSLCKVPCYTLSCDISEKAVKASFEALTNEKYGSVNDEN